MIFRDRITVVCRERKFTDGTAQFKVVFSGVVPGIVTFVDSNRTFDPAGGKVNSRLRIFLKPFGYDIRPNASSEIVLSWGSWGNLTPDGAVEPIYRNGRLSHYEIMARAA